MRPSRIIGAIRDNRPYLLLLCLIAIVALLGGSSREDAPLLLLLRPISFLCLAAAIAMLPADRLAEHRSAIWSAAAIAGLVALQLIPLPPLMWESLPGRDLLARAAVQSGNSGIWHPFAMVPWRAANTLFSLATPIAALLLAISATPRQRTLAMTACVAFACLSALTAIVQAIAGQSTGAGLYQLTSEGIAKGLFANRNHQAALLACAIPMIAALISNFGQQGKKSAVGWRIAGGAAMVLIVPMAVLTGSRAGLLLLVLAMVSVLTIMPGEWIGKLRPARTRGWMLAAGAGTVAVVGVLVAVFVLARVSATDRLATTNVGEEIRFQMWGPIATMIWQYFPFGSGVGSFVEVFQIGEPAELLTVSYHNHAHNDWLELLLEGGVVAAAIIALAVWRYFGAVRQIAARSRRESATARAGATIIALLAIASFFDYPLRTPSLSVVFGLACVWMSTRDDKARGRC